jgi:hypothetical protein
MKLTALLVIVMIAGVTGQPTLEKPAAFALCHADPVCSDLYSLDVGGSSASFWMQVQIVGIPPGPDQMLADFLALSSTDQKNELVLSELIKIGTYLPQCPYDMILQLDPVTGIGTCVCPVGVTCRPACTETDTWVWVTVSCGLVLLVLLFIKYTLFELPGSIKKNAL